MLRAARRWRRSANVLASASSLHGSCAPGLSSAGPGLRRHRAGAPEQPVRLRFKGQRTFWPRLRAHVPR
eukprot:608582-Alexandrium_andersonii.AAC.1